MKELPVLLDRLELAAGPADPVPSADGWELVLAENVAYLVDDQRRWQALAALRTMVGLAPDQILAAPEDVLRSIVAGARPAERARRLRQYAELAIAGAPWRAYPGIGRPATVAACQRAYQLLRRHGQVVCRRKDPSCSICPVSGDCPSAGHPPPLY